jgi:crotonobetainyl-CoA:carnitine CoA-transferase CaiB-like acyl-CoA transferase
VERRAPLLGEDTDRVLSELLNVDATELARLHAARVIEPVKS